jgi:hypothetical protein
MDFTDVKQVRRTNSENEANALLEQGWVLLHITSNGYQFHYLLVRT